MPLPSRKPNDSESINIRYEDCWAKTTEDGKPGISVRDHCMNVGCVTEAILERMPQYLRDLLPPGVVTLAALHDVGKVSPGFQVKCPKWLEEHALTDVARREGWLIGCDTDHTKIGQRALQEHITPGNDNLWAAIVGAHHGKMKGTFVQGIRETNTEHWNVERTKLIKDLEQQLGALPNEKGTDAVLFFTAGLIAVADWIGSNEIFFPLCVSWSDEERKRKARKAVACLGFQPVSFRKGIPFAGLFPKLREPLELQKTAIEHIHAPGLYVLEGPMGCGKTEAALAAAYDLLSTKQASGIYFALPTQTTSNRIHLRIEPFIKLAGADLTTMRLAHGASWLEEDRNFMVVRPAYEPDRQDDDSSQEEANVEAVKNWFASSKRALLASVGVGTVDQALLGVVAAKHFFVRQFALAGKVVILDEIHTYDLYTGTLIDVLVRRLLELKCTVIVLSATLTKRRREKLLDRASPSEEYPLLCGETVNGETIEISADPGTAKRVKVCFKDEKTLYRDCMSRAEQGQCVLWIRNTVHEAQQTHIRLLSERLKDGPIVGLLHARFPFFRREAIENEWMDRLGKDSAARPNGCVLVSTQVVEQSVDIDADLLITDLAPTDMLLQRMGRLWRHERRNRRGMPELWIRDLGINGNLESIEIEEIKAALGKTGKVYAPYVLVRSLDQWRNISNVRLPHDIRGVLETTYADRDQEPDAWNNLKNEMQKEMKAQEWSATANTRVFNLPALDDEEGIQTRYGGQRTASLFLVKARHSEGELDLLDGNAIRIPHRWDFTVAKAIHRNVVKIPFWCIREVAKKTPAWLKDYIFSTCVFGVLGDSPDKLGFPVLVEGNTDSELYYRDDLGIAISRTGAHKSESSCDTEEWEHESCD